MISNLGRIVLVENCGFNLDCVCDLFIGHVTVWFVYNVAYRFRCSEVFAEHRSLDIIRYEGHNAVCFILLSLFLEGYQTEITNKNISILIWPINKIVM